MIGRSCFASREPAVAAAAPPSHHDEASLPTRHARDLRGRMNRLDCKVKGGPQQKGRQGHKREIKRESERGIQSGSIRKNAWRPPCRCLASSVVVALLHLDRGASSSSHLLESKKVSPPPFPFLPQSIASHNRGQTKKQWVAPTDEPVSNRWSAWERGEAAAAGKNARRRRRVAAGWLEQSRALRGRRWCCPLAPGGTTTVCVERSTKWIVVPTRADPLIVTSALASGD
jgi:hypothetical protein